VLALNPAQQKAWMLKATIVFSSKNYPAMIDHCEKTTKSAEMEEKSTKDS